MSTLSRASQPPDPYTNGIVLLQGFLQYFCQGIIFAQALKFWKRSSNDTMYLRCFVALLVLLAW
ncbi:hypothetical protein QCA50_000961 [Cerrena zonata]|uniref:Uncharacterized protein n=1 Tax=Cerrena zonata TaxID=2478898 RepID=A0AAW0GU84_9APHY